MAVTTGTQQMSTQMAHTPTPVHHSQHNMNSSSMSFSNTSNVSGLTVSNGTGVTISNLGSYLTTAGTSISNVAWTVYTNYMKPKTFKLR